MDFINKNGEHLFFILATLLGLLILASSILSQKIDKEKNILRKMVQEKVEEKGFINDLVQATSFLKNYEEKNRLKYSIIEDKFPIRKITKMSMVSALVVFIFGLSIQNVAVTVAGIPFGFHAPLVLIDMIAKNKRNKVQEQLGTAIKFFTSEFTTSRSVVVAMQRVLDRLPQPIRHEFERLTREFNSGQSVDKALSNFALRINNKYAFIFSRLLISYFNKGTEFGEHLIQLAEDIMDEQLSMSEGRTEIAMVRTTNLIMNAAVFISILIIFFIMPAKSQVFKSTAQGQMLITVAVSLSVASLTLGLKMED